MACGFLPFGCPSSAPLRRSRSPVLVDGSGPYEMEERMAVEFEITKRVVSGRSVTITSWCDGLTDTWAASAPALCHLLAGAMETIPPPRSRVAAIDRVVRCLTVEFDRGV